MKDYHRLHIPTSLGQQGLFETLRLVMPEIGWRRGESEMEGALIVSGFSKQQTSIKFRIYDDDPGHATVTVKFVTQRDDEAEEPWRDAFLEHLRNDVFPALSGPAASNTGDEESDDGVTPSKRRELSTPSTQGKTVPAGTIVFDLMDWIPAAGEDEVTVSDHGTHLTVTVGSIPSDRDEMQHINIVFDGAVHHTSQPFPGVEPIEVDFSTVGIGFCELVQIDSSQLLEHWTESSTRADTVKLHHYFVLFWEMGIAMNVIAETVQIT